MTVFMIAMAALVTRIMTRAMTNASFLSKAASEVLEKNLKFVIGNIVLAGSQDLVDASDPMLQDCRWLHSIHGPLHG